MKKTYEWCPYEPEIGEEFFLRGERRKFVCVEADNYPSIADCPSCEFDKLTSKNGMACCLFNCDDKTRKDGKQVGFQIKALKEKGFYDD